MLLTIINILLSPISFLLFITFSFGKESWFYTKQKTNIVKLKPLSFLLFYTIYFTIIAITNYLCNQYIDFNIWNFFTPTNLTVSVITWLITFVTLGNYFKGMEGNIMGFIFFPLLALSILALLLFGFKDVLSLWKLLTHNLPVLEINFWLRLILHSFFPFYILLFLSPTNKNKEDNKDWIAPIFSSLILQFFMFGFNWLIVYLFGNSLTLSIFFGEKQTIIYYLPMAGGFLFYLLKLTKRNSKNELKTYTYYLTFLSTGFIIIEALNYLNFIIPFFY